MRYLCITTAELALGAVLRTRRANPATPSESDLHRAGSTVQNVDILDFSLTGARRGTSPKESEALGREI
jgi:hypothetical protein